MPGLQRPNFFTGRLLTAEDFAAEQDYHREQHYRHNRLMLGSGVVRGLSVSVGSGATTPGVVSVRPGMAIDPIGRELELEEQVALALPQKTMRSATYPVLVIVRFTEQLTQPVPGPVNSDDDAARVVYTRTLEGCEVVLLREADSTVVDLGGVVVLARLVSDRYGRWRRDLKCRVRRVRSRG